MINAIDTIEELDTALTKICEEFPNKINPRDNAGNCAYTDNNDPSNHCLIGTLAVKRGWFLPGNEDLCSFIPAAASMAEEYHWPINEGLYGLLNIWQQIADGYGRIGSLPGCWEDVPKAVELFRLEKRL